MCLDYVGKLLKMWPTRTTETGEGTQAVLSQQELYIKKVEENVLCMLVSQFYHFQYVHPHCTKCWIWHKYFNYAAEGSIILWNISVNLQPNTTEYQNTDDYNLNNPFHKTWKFIQNRRKYESDIDLVAMKLFEVQWRNIKKGLHCIFMQWSEGVLKL